MSKPKYRVGDKVKTVAWEGNEPEVGIVRTADVFSWGISYVLEVEAAALKGDDSLRELTEDQIEGLVDIGKSKLMDDGWVDILRVAHMTVWAHHKKDRYIVFDGDKQIEHTSLNEAIAGVLNRVSHTEVHSFLYDVAAEEEERSV